MKATRGRPPERKPPVRRDWSGVLVPYLRSALRVSLGLAAAAVLIVGAVQLYANWREPQREPVPEPTAEAAYPPAMGEAPIVAPVRPGESSSFTVFGYMAQQADRSSDLREFVERAKQLPEAGGVSYAVAAMTYCNQWQAFREERSKLQDEAAGSFRPSPKFPERLRAISYALDRCEGLSAAETSMEAMFSLYESKPAKYDRILVARGKLQAAKTIEERQLVVREILVMRDPLLLSTTGRYLGQGSAGGAPQVDGRAWGGVSEAAYGNAWSLVPCSFGSVCDDTDPEVALTCAQHGQCFPGRKEMLKARMAPQDFDDMQRLLARLLEIVAAADAEALRPKDR